MDFLPASRSLLDGSKKKPWAGIEVLEGRIAPAGVIIAVSTLRDTTDAKHDTGSLRDAIYLANAAAGPATIVFQTEVHGKPVPIAGAITPAMPLPAITNSVTIEAPGIVLRGTGGLSVTGGSSFTLNGIRLSGGGLVINDNGAVVTVENSVITGSHPGASYSGGGISVYGLNGHLTIENCVITGNQAGAGGGIFIDSSYEPVTISKCVITGDTSQSSGGGVYINDYAANIAINNSVIDNNHVVAASSSQGGQGGGIAIFAGTLTIRQSTIAGNTVTGAQGVADTGGAGRSAAGGGIFDGSSVKLIGSRVTGNTAIGGSGQAGLGGYGGSAYGGGIVNFGGFLDLQQSVVSGNVVIGGAGTVGSKGANGTSGAAFHVHGGKAYAPGGGTNGGGGGDGGEGGSALGAGVFGDSSSYITVGRSTISANVARAGAGGNGGAGGVGGNGGAGGTFGKTVYHAGTGGDGGSGGSGGDSGLASGAGLFSSGSLAVHTSTVSGNTAVQSTAGIAVAGGAAGLGYHGGGKRGAAGTAGYLYASAGGGIYSAYGSLFLSEVTVAGNFAANGGGISLYQAASAAIHNSTIAYNKALPGGAAGLSATPDGNNDPVNVVSTIIAQNMGTDVTGGIVATRDVIGGGALLGALGYHFGGSTETILPSPLSPAVLNGPGLNPDNLTVDQNGDPFGLHIEIGAVQTVG